jgi:hypothetical protein
MNDEANCILYKLLPHTSMKVIANVFKNQASLPNAMVYVNKFESQNNHVKTTGNYCLTNIKT